MPKAARSISLVTTLLLATTLAGCGAFRRLAGNDVVVLEKADVRAMAVELRRPVKTICPREDVQMAVFADVVLEGENAPKRVETWQGRGSVDKNDKLDFDEFAFQSPHGRFDGQGWFAPDRNLLSTAGTEFQIVTQFKRRPDKFTLKTTYRPDYACIKTGGAPGKAGAAGAEGQAGPAGTPGAAGSDARSGGPGSDGAPGGPGASGTDGTHGPSINAYATMVKTPFYERLVGIVLTGDVTDFLLVPEGQVIVLSARGGDGGAGGAGGTGGPGGTGGSGAPGGNGGNGGQGGAGGNGGHGGHGGTIDLMIDPRFPALASQIQIDVAGGVGGAGGAAGSGGAAGQGGPGQFPQGGGSPKQGNAGSAGGAGTGGSAGRQGNAGKSFSNRGNVSDMFQNRANVTPL